MEIRDDSVLASLQDQAYVLCMLWSRSQAHLSFHIRASCVLMALNPSPNRYRSADTTRHAVQHVQATTTLLYPCHQIVSEADSYVPVLGKGWPGCASTLIRQDSFSLRLLYLPVCGFNSLHRLL